MKFPVLAFLVFLYLICLADAYFPWNAKVSFTFFSIELVRGAALIFGRTVWIQAKPVATHWQRVASLTLNSDPLLPFQICKKSKEICIRDFECCSNACGLMGEHPYNKISKRFEFGICIWSGRSSISWPALRLTRSVGVVITHRFNTVNSNGYFSRNSSDRHLVMIENRFL